MCGVVGIVAHEQVAASLCEALTFLQHRGQDAAGISVYDRQTDQMRTRKRLGMVRDVFLQHHVDQLKGQAGIGHVRYPTKGRITADLAHPLYTSVPYGISLAHNGNLVNVDALTQQVRDVHLRALGTESDTELLLNIFAATLEKEATLSPSPELIFDATRQTMQTCHGGYAVVMQINGVGLLGFRDPQGIRPLIMGARRHPTGRKEYMIASESAALQGMGFVEDMRDIAPGEAVLISMDGSHVFRQQCSSNSVLRPCLFEWVYLARPDSVIDGASVYLSRIRMGRYLAQRVQQVMDTEDIDVVVPVPECGITAATELARVIGKPLREGLVKNRFVGRTFIMPDGGMRRRHVQRKLSALRAVLEGKNVLLVDDSIVRGTTLRWLIRTVREHGGKNVHFASAAPPIGFQNVFGIDMPTRAELLINELPKGLSHEEIEREVAKLIGVDSVIYQTLADLKRSVSETCANLKEFESSVFDGQYPEFEGMENFLQQIEQNRLDSPRELQLSLVLPQETVSTVGS